MPSLPAPKESSAQRLGLPGSVSFSEQTAQTTKGSYWKAAFVVLSLVAMAFSATTPIYNIVARFSRINGGTPSALAQGPDGYLYGTTQAGGPHDSVLSSK